ncbi:MAG: DUF192 domain-containing protein [Candidatus Anstonellaceae archaeon]
MGTLIIKNLSKKTILTLKADICDNTFSRFIGLMFRRKPTNLFFKFDDFDFHPIHSFFVFFPFDALYLVQKKKFFKVVDFFEDIAPNHFFCPKNKNSFLLELQSNKRKRLKISQGDKLLLRWKYEK